MPRTTNRISLRTGFHTCSEALVAPLTSRHLRSAVALGQLSLWGCAHKKTDCEGWYPHTVGRLTLTNFAASSLGPIQEAKGVSNISTSKFVLQMESLSEADYSARGLSHVYHTTEIFELARKFSKISTWCFKLVMEGFHYLMNSLVPVSLVSDQINNPTDTHPFHVSPRNHDTKRACSSSTKTSVMKSSSHKVHSPRMDGS